jgi:hypothetical protein
MALGSVTANVDVSIEVELNYEFGKLCLDDELAVADAIVRERSGLTAPLDLYSRTFILPINVGWQDVIYREPTYGLRVICRDKVLKQEHILSDQFPLNFSKSLVRLIQEGRRSEVGYNCIDTGQELCGVARCNLNAFEKRNWTFFDQSECEFEPGDLITLKDSAKKIVHVACYLGKGLANEDLYISMWGDHGGLYISDLPAMRNFYSSAKFVEVGLQHNPVPLFYDYFEDFKWHYFSCPEKENFYREEFAKRCTSLRNLESIQKSLINQNTYTLYFFNVHVFALQKLAKLVFASFAEAFRPQVEVVDTIGDQYRITNRGKNLKTILLANYLPSSAVQDLTSWIGHIQKCLKKDIEEHALSHYSLVWKFDVSNCSSAFKKEVLAHLRKKGFAAGLERYYAVVDGFDVRVKQNIWLRFPIGGSTELTKKAIKSLLAAHALKSKKQVFKVMKAEDVIPKILADIEALLSANSAIRQCKFDVYSLAHNEKDRLMKFLEARGYIAFLDPTPYRAEESFKMIYKQDLVIAL